jgi:hypothetical protein
MRQTHDCIPIARTRSSFHRRTPKAIGAGDPQALTDQCPNIGIGIGAALSISLIRFAGEGKGRGKLLVLTKQSEAHVAVNALGAELCATHRPAGRHRASEPASARGRDGVGGMSEERIVECEDCLDAATVTLAGTAARQLAVDTGGLMALSHDDVQTAEFLNPDA